MRRKYSISNYVNIVEKLKYKYPLFNFTTDLMVGFPGETEEDFFASCNIARDIGFSHIHTFSYSPRQGTSASKMTDQIPQKLKAERSMIIRAISEENKINYRKMMLGKSQRVLVEKYNIEGLAKGYGENYIPVAFKTDVTSNNYFSYVLLKDILPESVDMTILGKLIS